MAGISEAMAIAVGHHQAGRLAEAEEIYRRILAAEPGCADVWHLLGIVADQQGQGDVAVEHFRRALEFKPDHIEALNNLGLALQDQGKLEEAVACYQRAIELKPDFATAYYNLGNAFLDQGKGNEAVASFQRAVALKPDDADAHSNLGSAFLAQRKYVEARECFRRALEIRPNSAESLNLLGVAFDEMGNLDQAIACYRRALELKPDFAEAYHSLGAVFHSAGDFESADTYYRRAIYLKPEFPEAHRDQSHLWLLTGDFERGWPEYEWRWKTGELPRSELQEPRWDGKALNSRSILLRAEQGLGDTIQFIRYASLVKNFGGGGTVILECQPPLTKLLASCPGIDRLVAHGDLFPSFDVQAPLLSLPGIFQTSIGSIPATVPYLSADPGLFGEWREKLKSIAGFKVGIVWQGNPGYRDDRDRSIKLESFAPLARIDGVSLVSLQKGSGVEQLASFRDHAPIVEFTGEFDESAGAFIDTAAIMKNLDLVIAPDTVIAHLAGALGVPVWLALPFVPDWRWLLDRSDSPWYPTMRLFRQRRAGDWAGVFDEMQEAIEGIRSSGGEK